MSRSQDSSLSAKAWIPFQPDEAVAAHALMEDDGKTSVDGALVVSTQKFTAGPPPKMLYINGPQAVGSGAIGFCTLAMSEPAAVLGSISAGVTCGPTNGTWTVSINNPGFISLGAGPVAGTSFVIRTPEATICKGLTKGAFSSSANTFTVDNVKAMSGLTPVAGSSNTLTIQNLFDDGAQDNVEATFMWNQSEGNWPCMDIKCNT